MKKSTSIVMVILVLLLILTGVYFSHRNNMVVKNEAVKAHGRRWTWSCNAAPI